MSNELFEKMITPFLPCTLGNVRFSRDPKTGSIIHSKPVNNWRGVSESLAQRLNLAQEALSAMRIESEAMSSTLTDDEIITELSA